MIYVHNCVKYTKFNSVAICIKVTDSHKKALKKLYDKNHRVHWYFTYFVVGYTAGPTVDVGQVWWHMFHRDVANFAIHPVSSWNAARYDLTGHQDTREVAICGTHRVNHTVTPSVFSFHKRFVVRHMHQHIIHLD